MKVSNYYHFVNYSLNSLNSPFLLLAIHFIVVVLNIIIIVHFPIIFILFILVVEFLIVFIILFFIEFKIDYFVVSFLMEIRYLCANFLFIHFHKDVMLVVVAIVID